MKVEERALRYDTWAAEISCLGGLLNCEDGFEVIIEQNQETVADLIGIIGAEAADPKLLIAVC